MIILILLLLMSITTNDGSHFNGGTITWAPLYPSSNSSSVSLTITQSYSWVYPNVNCATNIPTTGAGTYLICVANCSTEGPFTNTTISILTDCTSWSASLGLVFSSRSFNITLNVGNYFWIAYRGQAWRSLANAATNSSPSWSIVSLIDLRRRPDGLINTPPVVQIASPQYVIVNTTTAIKIPVSDVNTGDDLRCRWSSQNSSYGVDECADVCTGASTTNLANLSSCTLTFTGTVPGAWYAIALQVEDFINTTSTTPMSSVAVQFLIYVLTPNCSQVPVIIPLTGCLEVQINVPVTFTLYAMNYCNRTQSIITSLLPTQTINGMTVSNLINSTTNTSLVYVTLTWTPQASQIGSQQFCTAAYTSEKVQSNPYCVTFNVITSQPCATTTTSTTTTTTQTTTSTTTSTSATTKTTSTSSTSKTTSTTSTSATTTTSTSTTSSTTSTTSSTTSTTSTTTSTTSTSATTSSTSSTSTSTTSTTTSTTTTSTTTSTTSSTSSTTSTTSTTTSTTSTSATTSSTSSTSTSTTSTTTSTTTTSTTTSTTSSTSSTTSTTSTTTSTTSTSATTTSTSSTSTSTTSTTTSTTTTSTTTSTTSTTSSTTTTTSTTTSTTSTSATTTSTSSTSTSTTSTTTSTTTTSTTTSTTSTTSSTTSTTSTTTSTTSTSTTTTSTSSTSTSSTSTSTTSTTTSTTTTSTTTSTTSTTSSTTSTTSTTTSTTSTSSTTTSTSSTSTSTTSTTTSTTTTSTTTSTTSTTSSTTSTTSTTTSTTSTSSTTTSTSSTSTSTTSTTSSTTSTTSTTTSTSTSSTSATTTTVTTTTVTTVTTTSVTTTTQTTTKTSNSNQINVPLIVGISLLALLLALGCCGFWLYHLKLSPSARHHRQLDIMKKDLQKQIDTISTRNDVANSRSNKRLKNYIVDSESKMEDTMNSFVSHDLIQPTPTVSIKNKRVISTNAVKVEHIVQSSRQASVSVKSDYLQQNLDQSTSSVEKPSKPRYSSVSVSKMKRSLDTSEKSNDSDLNKSGTPPHDENEFSSASTAKIHITKVPRNKVSASPKTCMNISSAPAGIRTNQSATDNINSDAKPHSADIQEVQHRSSSKTKDIRSPLQQRTTIFSHVAVSKIKRINN